MTSISAPNWPVCLTEKANGRMAPDATVSNSSASVGCRTHIARGMTAFDRIHSGEPSVFANDQTFRSAEWSAFQANHTTVRDKTLGWEEFRDQRLAAKEGKKAKPLSGHANAPLNLPGSHALTIKRPK